LNVIGKATVGNSMSSFADELASDGSIGCRVRLQSPVISGPTEHSPSRLHLKKILVSSRFIQDITRHHFLLCPTSIFNIQCYSSPQADIPFGYKNVKNILKYRNRKLGGESKLDWTTEVWLLQARI